MKLKDQVVSLKLAKKLKELGVLQDSLFYWVEPKEKPSSVISNSCNIEPLLFQGKQISYPALPLNPLMNRNMGYPLQPINYAAFTVAELGELLPHHIMSQKIDTDIVTYLCMNMSIQRTDSIWQKCFQENTEANARAKMLIYLKENKLIS